MPASSAIAERSLNPLHSILLGFPVAFACAAVASDITYLNSAVMQWSNFSAWLIAGTAFFGGLVLAWAILAFLLARRTPYRGRALAYLIVVAAMWVLSMINSLHHARDAWGSVGTLGLVMSMLTALLALTAAWLGYSGVRREIVQ